MENPKSATSTFLAKKGALGYLDAHDLREALVTGNPSDRERDELVLRSWVR